VSLLRFGAVASLSLAALCAVGAWPTSRWAGAEGLVAMGLAAGVCLAGALAGWIPLARLAAQDAEPADRANAVLAGLAVRLGVTLAGVLAVLLGRLVAERGVFLAWIGIDYAVLLVLETRGAMRSVRAPRAGGAPTS
jgi:hypothetical protein